MSHQHELSSFVIPQKLIYENKLDNFILTGGSYGICLRLHSMKEICRKAFDNEQLIDKAIKVVEVKKRDGLRMKLPDNSAFPIFLPLIRSIQGAPVIPTLMVETGMSDDRTKIEVDCISIILGVNFMVESVLGIDLRTNEKSRKLESMSFITFDASVDALYDLYEYCTDDYHKGLVAVVLKKKALFKIDEVSAILQLMECVHGSANYESVCHSISKQYRQRMGKDPIRYLNAPSLPDRDKVRDILGLLKFQRFDLLEEKRYYENRIELCDNKLGSCKDLKSLTDKTIKEAESFVMQKLYRRRTVQTIFEGNAQDLVLPRTALSSIRGGKREEIKLPAKFLKASFTYISLHCCNSHLEQCGIEHDTPWHWLRNGSHAAVALLNCPDDVPKEAALRHLKQLYEAHSQRRPTIKTKFEHWKNAAIQTQLIDWGLPSKGCRCILLMNFYKGCGMDVDANSPLTPSTNSSEPPKGIKRLKVGSSSPEQKKLPPKVDRCLTALDLFQKANLLRVLLNVEFDEVLQEINGDELALQGLELVFQEHPAVARFILSDRSSAIPYLRERR